MRQRLLNTIPLIILVLAIVFASPGCGKFIGKLQANYYFAQANKYFAESQYRNAIEQYEIALAYNPNLVEAYQYLGESYKNLYRGPAVDTPENNERADKALEALRRAYEIDPYDKDVIYSLGDMYDRLRNFEEAEKLYLRILELEPTNMENYYVVAGFYKKYVPVRATGSSDQQAGGETEGAEEGMTPFQKAEEMYLRRIELDPENPEGYAYAAQFYEDLRPPDFDKAYKFHVYRTKLEPDNYIPWYAIGVNRFYKAHRLQNILSREERIKLGEEAISALKKAIEINPSYSFTYSYMNIVYRNIYAVVYPERKSRYIEEADIWVQRFDEARKKELEREKLERELRGIR
ncbi:MAG: tetratricopeptide repeat protein [Candidatus Aminicenantes bacterium]|nr:tetratricopeptide repeat protein [Candidatus Aminicenantes bacterium]